MKESFYNFVYTPDNSDSIYLYNSFSNALAELSEIEYEEFTDYVLGKNSISQDLLMFLVGGNFLIENSLLPDIIREYSGEEGRKE